VISTLDPYALLTVMRKEGIKAEVRQSAHYEGGNYLGVDAGDASLTFERTTQEEFLIQGDSETLLSLTTLARAISEVLQRAGLKHRFEVYLPGNQLVNCFSHDWPSS
jgi:hypothetical protein